MLSVRPGWNFPVFDGGGVRKAIGFYWTLQVNWVPEAKARLEAVTSQAVEEAAKSSQTIAMQREAIHRWAKENGFEIMHEKTYVELEPDRVLEGSGDELRKLWKLAVEEGATILYVDFSAAVGLRQHHILDRLTYDWPPGQGRFLAIDLDYAAAEKVRAHFAGWRNNYREWLGSKKGRKEKALKRAQELQAQRHVLGEVAHSLNEDRIFTMTGKLWTEETLRKFLKKYS